MALYDMSYGDILRAYVFSCQISFRFRSHVENEGDLRFGQIVKMDLEGMVCKAEEFAVPRNRSRHRAGSK
jgi:ATP-dependent DNA ligase